MIVFGCKYRLALINPRWEDELYKMFGYIVNEHGKGSKVVAAGGVEDHVHVLVSLSQNIAAKDLSREMKARSSSWINERRLCMGRFGWQKGSGYFSVSASGIEDVKRYIHNQKEHHKGKSFKDEMIALYKKHGFIFNEFYLPEELE